MLEAALTAGLCSVGCNVLSVGVVPTPAVAYLVGQYQCEAGIMISASHNPCEYNGIKIFQKTGYKLDDSIEDEIEQIILDNSREPSIKIGGDVGNRLFCKTAVNDYIEHVVSTTNVRFDGLSIALDCANGSASVCAKERVVLSIVRDVAANNKFRFISLRVLMSKELIVYFSYCKCTGKKRDSL